MISEFQNRDFALALAQVLDDAPFGGANASECQIAAQRIRDGDCESWHREWITLAERVRRDAIHSLGEGQQSQARDAFLRAARYYQAAGHFLGRNLGDARIATTAGASTYCFATAMRLSAPICVTRDLDFDGIRHTAYLHQAEPQPHERPTLLVVGEAGTTPLDVYLACAVAANNQGWNCLTVSCDNQQAAAATRALLTDVLHCPTVDPSCLALLSYGEISCLPLGTGRRRTARLQVMGSADTLKSALALQTVKASVPGPTITDDFQPGALSRFHQSITHWLAD